MFRNLVIALVLLTSATTGGAPPAAAQSRDALADAARAFDEAALREKDDNSKPFAAHKWVTPIVFFFENPNQMPNLVAPTQRAVKEEAEMAGIPVTFAGRGDDAAINYRVLFDENGLRINLDSTTSCFTNTWWKDYRIYKAELRLNPKRVLAFERCVYHEVMQSMGFPSHPHAAVSILSYAQMGLRALTPLDRNLIGTLYDARMQPGTKSTAASRLGCRILGERMGSSTADVEGVCRDRKGPTPEGPQ